MTRRNAPIIQRDVLLPELVVLSHMLWDRRAAASAWSLLEPDDFRMDPWRALFVALGEASALAGDEDDDSQLAAFFGLVNEVTARGDVHAYYLLRLVSDSVTFQTLDAWPVERLARRLVAQRPRPALVDTADLLAASDTDPAAPEPVEAAA